MQDFFSSINWLQYLKSKNNYPIYALVLIGCLLSVIISLYIFSLKNKPGESSEKIVAEISGAVISPGVYLLKKGDRVSSLVDLSGGFSKEAHLEWITKELNLAASLEDTQKVYIPFVWEKNYEVRTERLENIAVVDVQDNQDKQEETSAGAGLDINSASKESLEGLKGVGPAYADKIIANRPYKDLQDLVNMSGLPESTIEKFKEEVIFE